MRDLFDYTGAFINCQLVAQIIILEKALKEGMTEYLVNLLSSTLNPALTGQSQHEIAKARTTPGFAMNLMIVADNTQNEISLRQSALVVLKNMVSDHCTQGNIINQHDLDAIKASILQALIRVWGEKRLVPTLREVIHLIASKEFPDRWPEIVPACVSNVRNGNDLSSVGGSVQGLKAVVSVCSNPAGSVITLSNVCNEITFPLFELTNKLFENFSPETQQILVSIFKIFNLAIFYEPPQIFINNIHSLVCYLKKILEINIPSIVPLKRVCLTILLRFYSRHCAQNTTYKLLSFSKNFHQQYSAPFVETLLLQLLERSNPLTIFNPSLNCLSKIYKSHEDSSELIERYRQKIILLCLQKFKGVQPQASEQSVGSFITCLREDRLILIDFMGLLMRRNPSDLLSYLINLLNEQNEGIKEIILYIFAGLSESIEDMPDLHGNMSQFIVSYIMPILKDGNSPLLRARGCEIICNYSYINLEGTGSLQEIFQFVYTCLTQPNQPYLNIYGLEAFTKLINKYDEFSQLIIPYLQEILKKYTDLLKESNGEVEDVIKSFESFLEQIDGRDLEPYAFNLIQFLGQQFYDYEANLKDSGPVNNPGAEESVGEEEDQSFASAGCLACIRQILKAENLPLQFYNKVADYVFSVLIFIISDSDLDYLEEGLNILNLMLYKYNCLSDGNQCPLSQKYIKMFPVFAYMVLGVPEQIGTMQISEEYKKILMNLCLNPDEDTVCNIIGLLRNYAVCLGSEGLRGFRDEVGVSYLEYLFRMVRCVHLSKNAQLEFKYKRSERMVILAIYTTLLEHRILNPQELESLINDLLTWLKDSETPNGTQIPSNIEKMSYLENILIALNCYGDYLFGQSNCISRDWLLQEILNHEHHFIHEYQLQRLIAGVGKLIELDLLAACGGLGEQVMRNLVLWAERLCTLKRKTETNAIELAEADAEEEAQEDLIDQNTHMGLVKPVNANQQQQQEHNRLAYMTLCEDDQWDQEYNKYYRSPFESINELGYLCNVLRNCKSNVSAMLSPEEQQRISKCFQ